MAIANLEGKIVLVTGAASGIGRATALAFVARGAHVIGADVTGGGLDALVAEAAPLTGCCTGAVVDVTDKQAMQELAESVQREFGTPHVLINNAGIGYLGQFLDSDLAHWRRVIDVNLMGVVHGCHYFLPGMLAAGGPRHVLNVASSAANYPTPAMAAYAASKAAVAGFSEVLKMELAGSAVAVSSVFPGVINTPIVRTSSIAPKVTSQQLEKLQAYYAAEGCSPEVVAEAMVRAVQRGDDFVLTGPYARLVHHVRRLSLKLVRRLMLDSARKVGYL
jgi:NAD(P)-dependent dehydrogenase (short-subunit alcohol dehydrogenase family)